MSNLYLYDEYYPLFVLACDSYKHLIDTYLSSRHMSLTQDIISLFNEFKFYHHAVKVLINKNIDDIDFINRKCSEFMNGLYEVYVKKFYNLFEV